MPLSNAIVDSEYLQFFEATGGRGIWSDAIYELTNHARRSGDQNFMLMDWGFGNQLQLLSRGRIKMKEVFWVLRAESREEELADWLYQYITRDGSRVFVFHAPQCMTFTEPRRVFDRMVEKYHLTLGPKRVFYQRDGQPVYILERVAMVPAEAAPWR